MSKQRSIRWILRAWSILSYSWHRTQFLPFPSVRHTQLPQTRSRFSSIFNLNFQFSICNFQIFNLQFLIFNCQLSISNNHRYGSRTDGSAGEGRSTTWSHRHTGHTALEETPLAHAALSRGTAGHKRSRPGDAPALLPRPPDDAHVLTHAEPGIQKVLGCTRHFENVKCKNVSETRIAKNSGITIGDAGVICWRWSLSNQCKTAVLGKIVDHFLRFTQPLNTTANKRPAASASTTQNTLQWFRMKIFTVPLITLTAVYLLGAGCVNIMTGVWPPWPIKSQVWFALCCTVLMFCSDVEHAFHCCIPFAWALVLPNYSHILKKGNTKYISDWLFLCLINCLNDWVVGLVD